MLQKVEVVAKKISHLRRKILKNHFFLNKKSFLKCVISNNLPMKNKNRVLFTSINYKNSKISLIFI